MNWTFTIPPFDTAAAEATAHRLDQLTKPKGSLGRLEELAIRLAGITGNPRCQFHERCVFVLAADHGVAQEVVSLYPQTVTVQMVRNFLAGGAAINVLARHARARVVVADFGTLTPLEGHLGQLVERRFGPGTRNMAIEPAMTRAQAAAAVEAGRELVAAEASRGLDLALVGEMGIGNTTAASAVTAALLELPAGEVTGRGTGLDEAALRHKVEVIQRALVLHRPDPNDALDVLAKVGGFELAGLAGVMIGAAERRIPVLVDGFIAGAAALAAARLAPGLEHCLIAGHRSAEPGHRHILDALGLRPLLDLDLRLGEGTGAALALHLVDAAIAIRDEMATFEDAGVDGPNL